NGTAFEFAGLRSNVDSVKSMEGVTIAYVSEARTVSANSIKVLTPTIRETGSEIWWDWNPEKPTDPVDAMFRGGNPPPGSIVREINYTDNPWFADPMKSEMEWDRDRDPDRYAHVWLGQYVKASAARVFRNWRVEEFGTPADAILRFGADWGFAQDPTVLIRAYVDDVARRLYVDQEASGVGVEVEDTPALFAGDCPKDKKDRYGNPLWENPAHYPGVPGALKWMITADGARPETVSHMRRKGFSMKPAIKGPGSIEDGVAFLKGYEIIVHPRCVLTPVELASYSHKVDPQTEEILPLLADKDNNTIDALRYAVEGLRRAPRPQAPKTSPNPSDLWGRPKQGAATWKTA
ncbi:MAG: terminase large subunit, partial [Minisyncoccia bacterium]